jgi:hypothetical protein
MKDKRRRRAHTTAGVSCVLLSIAIRACPLLPKCTLCQRMRMRALTTRMRVSPSATAAAAAILAYFVATGPVPKAAPKRG